MTSRWRVALTAAVGLVLSWCVQGCEHSAGCEDALAQTKKVTLAVCSEVPYDTTPFCAVCVAGGYLSTTGPTDCRCKLLAYEQTSCVNPSDDDAKAAVRGAIKWANESCATFSIAGPADGGAEDAAATDAGGDTHPD